MKVLSIVGARPQFIKAAVVSDALRNHGIFECLVHTGQHFDDNMSKWFFDELELPDPDYHLGVSGGSHGRMTGRMLEKIEIVIQSVKPNLVLLYGDTNSTLAGAIAAAKLSVPIAHVESGLRSFSPSMPEEINRKLTDHLSTLLFCPTKTAVSNLAREGAGRISNFSWTAPMESSALRWRAHEPIVVNVGDVMVDALYKQLPLIQEIENPVHSIGLRDREYALVTLHRAGITADAHAMEIVCRQLASLSNELPVFFPLHPRTRAALGSFHGLDEALEAAGVHIAEPLGHRAFLSSLGSARVCITDSGGVQKEACILKVPCVTVRQETEWVETVDSGWNILVGERAENLASSALNSAAPENVSAHVFGDGHAADYIAEIIASADST